MQPAHFSYKFYATTQEAWDAMHQALLGAKKSIYWEVFIFDNSNVGKKFIDILCDKARRGIEVKLIIDAVGSYNFSRESEERLRESGAELLRFNRLHPEWKINNWLARLWYRNHRKVLIIDEEIVFLGGVNIDDDSNQWDDVYLKIKGKVARPLLRGFVKSYISSGGKRSQVKHLLHPKLKEWQEWRKHLQFIVHSPRFSGISKARKLYLRALATAKESVNLITPYYVPDRQFLKALALAQARGVKVNIFLPLRPDHKFMELIARTYYELTIKAGATIYLLPTMNHGKAFTVDNKLGMVGSINVTPRSFKVNEESGVYFTHEAMVNDLNKLFNAWKTTAQPFEADVFGKRNWWERVKEWWAKRIEEYV